jgi:hypothetical protein
LGVVDGVDLKIEDAHAMSVIVEMRSTKKVEKAKASQFDT